jgi:hypothetical protein
MSQEDPKADPAAASDKQKRVLKQCKRMEKMLGRAWQLGASVFQHDKRSAPDKVLSLTTIGEKLDQKAYRLGRHGWEDFAKDLGGVYNRHVHR